MTGQKVITAYIITGIICASVLTYTGIHNLEFVTFDDYNYVVTNTIVNEGLTTDSIKSAFTSTSNHNWHPITWISHMFDIQNFGLNPAGHHLMNLLIHCLNAVLLFVLLSKLSDSVWKPAAVALLFAIHPVNVETVAWVSERKNVLGTLFWLLTLYAYTVYTNNQTTRNYMITLFIFITGLMTKSILIVVPVTMLLLDFWPLQRISHDNNNFSFKRIKSLLYEKTPFIFLAICTVLFALSTHQSSGAAYANTILTMWDKFANASASYIAYIINLFWPINLSPHYPHPLDTIPFGKVAACSILFISITVWSLFKAKKYPYIAFGWFWYILSIFPTIGFIQVGWNAYADHYAYVPYIGLYILIVWSCAHLFPKWNLKIFTVVACIAISLSITTHTQMAKWQSSRTLFEHTINVTNNNWRIHREYANFLKHDNDTSAAIEHFTTALSINPNDLVSLNDLGTIYKSEGKLADAVNKYLRIFGLNPNHIYANKHLAEIYLQTNDLENATKHAFRFYKLVPYHPDSHYLYGKVLARNGNPKEAIALFTEALKIDPNHTKSQIELNRLHKSR